MMKPVDDPVRASESSERSEEASEALLTMEPAPMTAVTSMDDGVPTIAVETVRKVVEENFPGLWPAVALGLSTAATLLLKDSANPVALIYVGGPSTSKTTVADLFADHPNCYVSDNFTPASFVSHAANVGRKKLDSVDLLPRIKHKVLVTPELAPIFRGKEDDLVNTFKIITRVLDGQGLMTDSGTHGRRGYRGDYLFAWLGATTPFDPKVWRVMAQLGSRLFFWGMDDQEEVTVEELVESEDEVPYSQRLDHCKRALHEFLTNLFKAHGGVRSIQWRPREDCCTVKEWIARFAKVLAAMRSEPVREADPDRAAPGFVPPKREQPRRAYAILCNLARGHALVHGRSHLSLDDLPLVARVTVCSMPTECARVFEAAVKKGEPLAVADVQAALGVKHPETARKVMKDLDQRGVMEYTEEGLGKPALLRFRPEWDWCSSREFRALLLGEG